MRNLHLVVVVCGLSLVALASRAHAAMDWRLLVAPNGMPATYAYGVSGTRIVGSYQEGLTHGLVYDIATGISTTMDIPGAYQTELWEIDGDRIVGHAYAGSIHSIHSDPPTEYLYDAAGWRRPVGPNGRIEAISGDRMVLTDGGGGFGFWGELRTGTEYHLFGYPGASDTFASDIDGTNIVGTYWDIGERSHGYLYDSAAGTWKALDYPGATETFPTGISGDRIVGWYRGSTGPHGFLYDGVNWESLDYPGGMNTRPYGICGDYVVGTTYVPTGGPAMMQAAFLLTVPEPATLALLALAGLRTARRRPAWLRQPNSSRA